MSGMLLDQNTKPSSTAPPPASFSQDGRMTSFLHSLPHGCGWCCVPAFDISQPGVQQLCLFLSHVGNPRCIARECVYTSLTVTNVNTTSPNSKFTSQMKQKPSVHGQFFIPLCSQAAKRQTLKRLCTRRLSLLSTEHCLAQSSRTANMSTTSRWNKGIFYCFI